MNNIFHFSYFDSVYPKSWLTVTGLARVYSTLNRPQSLSSIAFPKSSFESSYHSIVVDTRDGGKSVQWFDYRLIDRGIVVRYPAAASRPALGYIQPPNQCKLGVYGPDREASRAMAANWFMLISSMAYSSTLKIEPACSSETSVDLRRTTRRYIAEDKTLQWPLTLCFSRPVSSKRKP
jgi:hypothetical protein